MSDENQPFPAKGALLFDFNRAVAAVCKDYPEETRNITFINAANKDAGKQLAQWIENTTPAFKEWLLTPFEVSSVSITMLAPVIVDSARSGYSLKDDFSGEKALLLTGDTKDQFLKILAPDVAAFTALNHELAHLILKEGLLTLEEAQSAVQNKDAGNYERLIQKTEIVADVFAVMRGLQAGYISKKEVEELAAFRAGADDLSHDTSKALKALLETHKDTDFTALTPQQIKAAAVKHTQKFAP